VLTYNKETNAVLCATREELDDIRSYYIVIDGSWNKPIGQQDQDNGGYALLLEEIDAPEAPKDRGRSKAFFTQGDELIREDSDLDESTPFSVQ
jgi:hypothetical protein